jgi:hypothetical protein
MCLIVHHPMKVDEKWRHGLKHSYIPHQMEMSVLASRAGRSIPGKELSVLTEREVWWGLRAGLQAVERRKISGDSGNPTPIPRSSCPHPSLYTSINLLIRI